jgi:hypothetical protein
MVDIVTSFADAPVDLFSTVYDDIADIPVEFVVSFPPAMFHDDSWPGLVGFAKLNKGQVDPVVVPSTELSPAMTGFTIASNGSVTHTSTATAVGSVTALGSVDNVSYTLNMGLTRSTAVYTALPSENVELVLPRATSAGPAQPLFDDFWIHNDPFGLYAFFRPMQAPASDGYTFVDNLAYNGEAYMELEALAEFAPAAAGNNQFIGFIKRTAMDVPAGSLQIGDVVVGVLSKQGAWDFIVNGVSVASGTHADTDGDRTLRLWFTPSEDTSADAPQDYDSLSLSVSTAVAQDSGNTSTEYSGTVVVNMAEAVVAFINDATYTGWGGTYLFANILESYGHEKMRGAFYATPPAGTEAQGDIMPASLTPPSAVAVGTSLVSVSGNQWGAVVILGGVDVSSRLTGIVRVEAEESVARIAEFSLAPVGGVVSLSDWIGATVTIEYQADGDPVRIFTGVVDMPIYDPASRVVTFMCTDRLQQTLADMPKAALDTICGGHWSPDVFDENADGWQYAQDRMSTRPDSLDMLPNGQSIVVTPWTAKAVPDFEYNDTLDSSMQVSLVERSDVFNIHRIEFQYRFSRNRHRVIPFGWAHDSNGTFCHWFDDSSELPTDDMISSAANGAGAAVGPINFTYLPDSENDPCGDGSNWINNGIGRFVLAATWSASIRMSQWITETYRLELRAPQSIAACGELVREQNIGVATDYDSATWEETDDTDIPEGAQQDIYGDWVADAADRDQVAAAAAVVLNRAKTETLDAHRRNQVTFIEPLEPGLDRLHTVSVDSAGVAARGKVHRLVHEMDMLSARATTQITIRVSRAIGVADSANDNLALPEPPNTAPSEGMPASAFQGTHLGGKPGAPAYNQEWTGFTGNYTTITPGAETYPRRFSVQTPEIAEGFRDPVEREAHASYEITIPNEPLSMEV